MQENNKGQELEMISHLKKGDQFVLYVFQRISRVSQAIYIVTDMVKDEEPLKWILRKTASETAALRHFFKEYDVLDSIEKPLLELEDAVHFASTVTILSKMNSAILLSQIKNIIVEIKEAKGSAYSSQFNQEFFDIPKPAPALTDHKGHNVLYDFYTPVSPNPVQSSKPKAPVTTSGDKGQRSERMLKIIRNKGEVTIRDITDQIKDYSEKTIQRELTQMVSEGVLKKTGERRWSKYSVL